MILYGKELIKKIRHEFDNAKSRIWIVVPFIGDWNAVKKIMGTKWITNNSLDVKIITDIRNEGFINPETINRFLFKAEVKTLPGLHAKIYIIDNSVFITSANLTGTAFSKRYEICKFTTVTSDREIINIFNDWWKISKKVNINWQPQTKIKSDAEAGNTNGLKKLWDLPEGSIKVRNFKDYQDNIVLYNHFSKLYYGDKKKLLPQLNKYHELDAFLNYLFHEEENTPSHEFLEKTYRKISDDKRISEIRKYKSKFKIFLKSNPSFENYRPARIKSVQRILSKRQIEKLDLLSLTTVVDTLHTMNSHALNRHRFLNSRNNQLATIKDAFNILLHDNRAIEERMELCNDALKFFGKSSIRELVAWFYPDDYPIMNRNTNSGMKFLGYDIVTY